MDLTQAIVALTAFVTALSGLVPVVISIWKRLSAQERRLNDFWESHLLRGTSEGLTRGLLVEQVGPEDAVDSMEGGFMTVAVTPLVAEAFAPIADKLVAMRQKYKDACRSEFAELIERRFGAWLARFICTALGVNQFACIVMAISIADGVKPAEPPPDSKSHRPI